VPKAQLIDPTLGPDDARIIPSLAGHPAFQVIGREDGAPHHIVRSGDVVEGPDDVIGAGPSWRAPKPGDDLAFMETRTNDQGEITSVHDLGRGLLAQLGIWERPDDEPVKGAKGADS